MTESAFWRMRTAAVAVCLLVSTAAFSANITVPTIDLITHAYSSAGLLTLQTYGNLVVRVEGGYKFGAQIDLNFLSSLDPTQGLESPVLPWANTLGFYGASVTVRDVFASSVDFSYFVGRNDIFCEGDGFGFFGTTTFSTSYSGFMYFPTGPLYDGIYRVDGTGVRVDITPIKETLRFSVYAYQDTHGNENITAYIPTSALTVPAPGSFSGDFRALLNFDAVKLEAFFGGTYTPTSTFGLYRGGALFYASNKDVEFFAQFGVPEWDASSIFSINLFYLLFEPRLHVGQFSIVPTFFWHPAYYMQFSIPSELGNFDVNVNAYFGDLVKSAFRGGLEGNFKFQSSSLSSPGILQTRVSPYVSFVTPGALWTLKVNFKLFPFDLGTMIDAFLGVQATI